MGKVSIGHSCEIWWNTLEVYPEEMCYLSQSKNSSLQNKCINECFISALQSGLLGGVNIFQSLFSVSQWLCHSNFSSIILHIIKFFNKGYNYSHKNGLTSQRFFFGGGAGCNWYLHKLWGQGSNPHHSSDLSHSSDNVGSLTLWATRKLLTELLNVVYDIWFIFN